MTRFWNNRKTDIAFAAGLIGILFAFYPELFLARSAPLVSDHLEQHFPWASLLWHSLREGRLPLWTPLIQSGFPIAAESQIGIFYLPNLILSLLLPLRWAYSYTMVIHFAISGLGVYAYCRAADLKAGGAFTAAIVFLFGTAYGGAYYNITSLKTICWLPVMMFLLERGIVTRRLRYFFAIGFCAGLSLIAGYLQVATLALFIFGIYALIRLFAVRRDADSGIRGSLVLFFYLVLSALISVLIAAPQILLTFQLALRSNRVVSEEAYAYVGSLSPAALATFVFPHFQAVFRGNCLYGGISALFLFVAGLLCVSKSEAKWFSRLWLVMAVITLFLALGRWSPLYVGLIKLTHFYSFRTPAKFLVFFNLAFAMLAGAGAHQLVSDGQKAADSRAWRRAAVAFMTITLSLVCVSLLTWLTIHFARPFLERLGLAMVEKLIFGIPGHPHTMEFYALKLSNTLDAARDLSSPLNRWNLWIYAQIALTALMLRKLFTRAARPVIWLGILLVMLVIDLYAFSWKDIKQDFAGYDQVKPQSVILDALQREAEGGRIVKMYGLRGMDESLPLVPSLNMLYGIADIGAYSPLMMSRYYEAFAPLGNINDSNLVMTPDTDYVLSRLPLLASLGVSHILSTRELSSPKLGLLEHDAAGGIYLYRALYETSEVYFSAHYRNGGSWPEIREALTAEEFEPRAMVLLDETAPVLPKAAGQEDAPYTLTAFPGNAESRSWEIQVSAPGVFVWTQCYYPGWTATVNGATSPLFRAQGLFQAVYLPAAGTYRVVFRYSWKEGLAEVFQR